MANVFDYLDWRGDLTLDLVPLCDVDALVLSRLSYLPLDGLVPPEGATVGALMRQLLASKPPLLLPEDGRFIPALAASQRFCEMRIMDYVNQIDLESQTQFAAITVALGDGRHFVAFRGTDGTLVGWKEDFNMAYAAPVPAQESARCYVDQVAECVSTPLVLGGHSKGGNLAVYAAAKASPRTAVRIAAVYDHDGPGFPEGVLAEGELDRARPLVRKTVPQESLVGLLMESDAGYRVVKSSGRGISQHSPFRWEVEDGAVVEADGLAPSARFTAEVLNEWIAGMDPLERRRAVGALFEALRASGAKDAFDVLMGGPKTIGVLADAARNTRPEAREVIIGQMKALAAIAAKRAFMRG